MFEIFYILACVWCIKAIMANYWLYQQKYKLNGRWINWGLYVPAILSMYFIFNSENSFFQKLIVTVLCFDPQSYKILKPIVSLFHPNLREGYKYHGHLKKNPMEMREVQFHSNYDPQNQFFANQGMNLMMLSKNMVQDRLDGNDHKMRLLERLLSENQFIHYFKTTHSEFYQDYKSYLASNEKLGQIESKGAEIAAIVLQFDLEHHYADYIKQNIMKPD